MNQAAIRSLQIGKPQTRIHADEGHNRTWRTGIYKSPVADALWLGKLNLAGDGQADLKNHGGPDKAVCVYASEHYPYWADQLGIAAPDIQFGAFGENFTTEGLLETEVCIGDVFRAGGALVEVSQPRQPCYKLARRWGVPDMVVRVQDAGYTGWYFRVLEEGQIRAGDAMRKLDNPHPVWTIAALNGVLYDVTRHHRKDREKLAALAMVQALPEGWRDMFAAWASEA